MPESVLKLRGKTRAESLAVRGHERTSLFIKAPQDRVCEIRFDIQPQAQRQFGETARIISMRTDTFGIAHVSYEVSIARRHIAGSYFEGPRTGPCRIRSDYSVVLKSRLCVRGSSLF